MAKCGTAQSSRFRPPKMIAKDSRPAGGGTCTGARTSRAARRITIGGSIRAGWLIHFCRLARIRQYS